MRSTGCVGGLLAPAVLLAFSFCQGLPASAQESMSMPSSMPAHKAAAAVAPAAVPDSSVQPVPLTPVIVRVEGLLPQPFVGGDGKFNVVYDLLLTNFSPSTADLQRLDICDEDDNVLASFSGAELGRIVVPISNKGTGEQMAPGSCAVAFINLKFCKREQLPALLVHKLTLIADAPAEPHRRFNYEVAPVAIDKRAPVLIGAPLAAGCWEVRGGCDGNTRRTLFGADNRLISALRFAL